MEKSIFDTWKEQIIKEVNEQYSMGDLRDCLKENLETIEESILEGAE